MRFKKGDKVKSDNGYFSGSFNGYDTIYTVNNIDITKDGEDIIEFVEEPDCWFYTSGFIIEKFRKEKLKRILRNENAL